MNSRDLRHALKAGRRDFRREQFANLRLTDFELEGCDFSGTTFRRTTLSDSSLNNCDFRAAQFAASTIDFCRASHTNFDSAYFDSSVLRDLQLQSCSMEGVTLDYARIEGSRIWDTNLEHLVVHETDIRSTEFGSCNAAHAYLRTLTCIDSAIADFCDAADLVVEPGGLAIDWASVCRSIRSPKLLDFLIASGMPELFAFYSVDCAKALDPKFVMKFMRSVFISYGSPDAAFARRLQIGLQHNGVRTFFFERDAIPGMKLHEVMREGVNRYDRIVLICSHASLDRLGVVNEIEQALAREARDGGASYLIPVTIDDYVFRWVSERPALAQEIRDRVVADFRGTEKDEQLFAKRLSGLLIALRING